MLCLSVIVSLTIEVTQMVIGRVFDVDDIILNILGAMCGYFIYRFIVNIKDRLPHFLKTKWCYNTVVVIIVFLLVWYLYKIMWIGV